MASSWARMLFGSALVAGGSGHRKIAGLFGRPVSTVRGWLRRFGVRAESVRLLFTSLLHAIDACAAVVTVTRPVFADALEALGLAAAAATRVFGPRPVWHFAAAASGGQLLGPVRPTRVDVWAATLG